MSFGKRIKSYLVFTSLGYRLILYLAVPLAAAGISLGCIKVFGAYDASFLVHLLILAEVLADHWFLSGIQEKNAEKLDYLKTSARGMEVMKSALVLDLARRFLELLLILVLCGLLSLLLGTGAPGILEGIVLPVLTIYVTSVIATVLARFGSTLQINFLAAYLAAVIGSVCYFPVAFHILPAALFCPVLAFLSLVVSVLAVKVAMKKVKEGYYDK